MRDNRAFPWVLSGVVAVTTALVVGGPGMAGPGQSGATAAAPDACQVLTLSPSSSPAVIKGPGVLEAVLVDGRKTRGLSFEGLRGQTGPFTVYPADDGEGTHRLELNVAFDGELTVSALDGRGPEAYLLVRLP